VRAVVKEIYFAEINLQKVDKKSRWDVRETFPELKNDNLRSWGLIQLLFVAKQRGHLNLAGYIFELLGVSIIIQF